ncbi:MAG: NAD-dependent epimerase/dehydratase family protein, partial [Bradymonadia bacterium]
ATVVLTGSGGLLGPAIQRWKPSGYHLIATDINAPVPEEQQADEFRTLDILKASKEDFSQATVVIHNAGLFDLTASVQDLTTINVEGSKTVAQAAIGAGVKHFVQISSTSVYGPQDLPIPEGVPNKSPVHRYGVSKWRGEIASRDICQRANVSWTSIRPTLIYGPGSRYGIAPFIAALDTSAHANRRLLLPTGGPLCHAVHVDDVARAVWHAVQHQLEGPYNVADHTPMTFGQLLALLATLLGVKHRSLPLPWSLLKQVLTRPSLTRPLLRWSSKIMEKDRLRIKSPEQTSDLLSLQLDEDWAHFLTSDYQFDTRKLTQTGFTFRYPNTNEGLIEAIEWYRVQGWL